MTKPAHPLARLRAERGFTTASALAKRAGLSAPTISRFEGRPDEYPIGHVAACKLAAALGMTVAELAAEVGSQVQVLEVPAVQS